MKAKPAPTDFDDVFTRMATGASLSQIARELEIPESTIRARIMSTDINAERYARATEKRAEWYAEQIMDIADDDSLDANDKRVRIDARKWVACKLLPRRFGDKQEIKHSGGVKIYDVEPMK